MSARKQRRVAAGLTPILAELFAVPPSQREGIKIRFHPYPPRDFAAGGRLLIDTVPWVGRLMKRLLG